MDRFIDQATKLRTSLVLRLKSNMDRFIGKATVVTLDEVFGFKIQYG